MQVIRYLSLNTTYFLVYLFLMLTETVSVGSATVVGCSTHLFYTIDRVVGALKEKDSSERVTFIRRNLKYIVLVSLVEFIILLTLILNSFNLMIYYGIFLCFCVFYDLIKKIPLVKSFFVGFCWANIVVIIPLVLELEFHMIELLYPSTIVKFLITMMLGIASVSMRDIDDCEIDKINGVVTFPTVYGKTNSIIICNMMFLITVLFEYVLMYFTEAYRYNILIVHTIFMMMFSVTRAWDRKHLLDLMFFVLFVFYSMFIE
ncbi:putative UbiA prenyltransferase [Yasminevirus sp. GU-2018]|uniref:Putative UbiA prenyltransferase n=1 Tax=Yasminevirus sp. GU-2018 TaxID=2420051 RepID=A0A5K0U991_9VIRU|nr:putative UbiA prenyltransferase [Yasminevirus sp. GU-2018]